MEQKLEIHLPKGEELDPRQLIRIGAEGWALVSANRYQGLPRDSDGELTDGTAFYFEKREAAVPSFESITEIAKNFFK